IIIAHRGASGYRPEHTEIAYRLAVSQGADYIEPDLVPTKDGHLIVRHENELGSTTDVDEKPEFKARFTTKTVDGVTLSGWFSEDFTLAEIKTLRAKERIPDVRPDNVEFDGTQEILTLEEVIQLAQMLTISSGRPIGIYPETKHPTYFKTEGIHLDGDKIQLCISCILVQKLVEHDFMNPNRVFIQSFEVENLLRLKNSIMPEAGVDFPLIQLMGDVRACAKSIDASFSHPYDIIYHVRQGVDLKDIYGELGSTTANPLNDDTCYGDFNTAKALAWMADHYAWGIGPWKENLLNAEQHGTVELLPNALAVGLGVHPFTLRRESQFLTDSDTLPSIEDEIARLLQLGVTGYFTDNPDLGYRARQDWLKKP
ncbi:MAG: glycerophosphodiester phosphodiesterase family protein, partial [Pseudomonadota bacterium]